MRGLAFGLVLQEIRGGVAPHGPPRAGKLRAQQREGNVRWWIAGSGTAGLVALALFLASGPSGVPEPDAVWAEVIYDMDAQVEMLPLLKCADHAARVRVLSERGAHVRLSPAGEFLWFDAEAPDGRRQIYRLGRGDDRAVCWTCEESGNNWWPAPSPSGTGIAFISDRHVTWWHPFNSEIFLIGTNSEFSEFPSHRLTFSPGPDTYPTFGPEPRRLVWSRGEHGRFAVVTAHIESGHGGILLSSPRVLVAGGASWVAPLAWSPDARSLLYTRGNPYASLRLRELDPATGEEWEVAETAAWNAAADFTDDGGWRLLATAQAKHWARHLPAEFGFLLGSFIHTSERSRVLWRGSGVGAGLVRQPAVRVDLGAVADWGMPTGVALFDGGRGALLSQRRCTAGGVEERIVEFELTCDVGERTPAR